MRNRVVAVVSAAALTTGLFGQPVLTTGKLDALATVGLGCLVAIGVLALYVLLPRKWGFSNNVAGLVKASTDIDPSRRDDELADYLRNWAWFLQQQWEKQDKIIGRMTTAYGAASVLLVVLVVTWAWRVVR